MTADMWLYENECFNQGAQTVCGVDEAGRGPLAGPVCAAAVILPRGLEIPGLDDSKKLRSKKREKLFDVIVEQATAYAIAWADATQIDEQNILRATMDAMNRAISQLSVKPDVALIDGNRNNGIQYTNKCIVGGDGKSASIAAASILAKVSRDRLMLEMDKAYPQYAFAQHKGYGTKLHYERIRQYGPCPIHRASFLKKMH